MLVAAAAIVAAAIVATVAATTYFLPPSTNSGDDDEEYQSRQTVAAAQGATGAVGGSLTIITISSNSLLTGAAYSITPDPFTGQGAYTVRDGGEGDSNPAAGIIQVTGIRSGGNFTVTQAEAPPGYERNRMSKIVEIDNNNDSITVTFSNAVAGTGTAASQPPAKDIIYTAKFECGTISGSEGPLRPGHYDTDIGILNKQDFAVRMTWSAVVNDGKSTNSILKTLEPHASTGIVCKDLRQLVGGGGGGGVGGGKAKFVEGFVIVTVPLDASLQGALSGGSTVVTGRQGSSSAVDVLDVQVFYTANALEELPREVLVDKIVFTVTADPSGKLPKDTIVGRTLDITVRAGLDQVSDPAEKVRQALAREYGLTEAQASRLAIRIEGVGVGAGTMIDDHALSLSRVPPQTRS